MHVFQPTIVQSCQPSCDLTNANSTVWLPGLIEAWSFPSMLVEPLLLLLLQAPMMLSLLHPRHSTKQATFSALVSCV